MLISALNQTNYSTKHNSFKGLHVPNPNVQKLILTTLDDKQLKILSSLIKGQNNNSVHIILNSTNGKRLNASLYCGYRLKNFNTQYKQIPFIESKIHFIKRIVSVANKYQKQISGFKTMNLNWIYEMLPDWIAKMY